MNTYQHHVSGFFARAEEAEDALARLAGRGLPRERLHLFEAGSNPPAAATQAQSNAALKDMLVDGVIGTAVGTGIGALGEWALVAANVSLFIASPLVAPLVMLGWGASLGGLIGAAAGALRDPSHKDGTFSALVRDAISNGQVVLVAQTLSEDESTIARDVIKTAVGAYKDVATV